MSDEALRSLERAASTGEPGAQEALQRERCRVGRHGPTAVHGARLQSVHRTPSLSGREEVITWSAPLIEVHSSRCAECRSEVAPPDADDVREALRQQPNGIDALTGTFSVLVLGGEHAEYQDYLSMPEA